VNANTPSGTVIADTASVTAATSDPNPGNSSATAQVTVGTGTSADVALTKTAAPSPVAQGNLLTFTLIATNNGPASATNMTVVDVLPATLKFVSVVTTAGTCSQAANTVTCQLGTIVNAGTATINIVVTPQSSTIVTNSATVTADQTDATPANNVATVTTLVTAPTRIHLQSLTAEATKQGVVLRWKTAGELNNLGFNVYREQNGERVRLNSTLVAGSASGHRGQVLSLRVGDHRVLVFVGRIHAYEGHELRHVVHPVRTACAAGARTFVLTNAAGGLHDDYAVGQPVLISDHLNLTARSPLVGAQFVDMTDAYSPRLRALAREIDPSLAEGVYAGLPGPHYETPAEIRMLRTLGADLVGMSTVHETIAARAAGAQVLAVSLVTNLAAGMTGRPLSHDEVLEAGRQSATRMGSLLGAVIARV